MNSYPAPEIEKGKTREERHLRTGRGVEKKKKTISEGIVEGMLDEDAPGSCTYCHYAYTFLRGSLD